LNVKSVGKLAVVVTGFETVNKYGLEEKTEEKWGHRNGEDE
jgi:hypothetical protein